MFWFFQRCLRYFKVRRAKQALDGDARAWNTWKKWHLSYWRRRHDLWHALLDTHPISKKHVQKLLEVGFDPNLTSSSGHLFIEELSLASMVSSIEALKPFIEKAPHLPFRQWVEEEASTDFQSFLNENEAYPAQLETLFKWGLDAVKDPADVYEPLVALIQRNLGQLVHIRAWFDKDSIPLSLQNPSEIGTRSLSVGELQMQIHRSCQVLFQLMEKPSFIAIQTKPLEIPDFSTLLEPLNTAFISSSMNEELQALNLKLRLESHLQASGVHRSKPRL